MATRIVGYRIKVEEIREIDMVKWVDVLAEKRNYTDAELAEMRWTSSRDNAELKKEVYTREKQEFVNTETKEVYEQVVSADSFRLTNVILACNGLPQVGQ